MTMIGLGYGLCSFLFMPWVVAFEKIDRSDCHTAVKLILFFPLLIGVYVLATLFAAFCIIVWALIFIGYYVFVVVLVPVILFRFCI